MKVFAPPARPATTTLRRAATRLLAIVLVIGVLIMHASSHPGMMTLLGYQT